MGLSGKHLENIPFGYFTSCLQSKHHSNADEQRPKILVAKGAPFHFNLGNTDGMITCLTRAVLVACLLFRGVLAAEYLVGVGKDETTG